MERLFVIATAGLVMLALSLTVQGQVIPTDTTVGVGEQALLNCSGTQLTWLRQVPVNRDLNNIQSQKIFISPSTFHNVDTNRFSVSGMYNLVIKNANAREDGATYQCDTNAITAANVPQANLVVIDEIALSVSPSGLLSRGSRVTFRCTFSYGAPTGDSLSPQQDPKIFLFIEEESLNQDQGAVIYQAPQPGGGLYHTKTLNYNFTVSDTSPGRKLKCAIRSLTYEKIRETSLDVNSRPVITRLFQTYYNVTDMITCTADGQPTPTVTWTYVEGSMDRNMAGLTGMRSAVLRNLKPGSHMWKCTANNDLGSDSVDVRFNVLDVGQLTSDTSALLLHWPATLSVLLQCLLAIFVMDRL